MKIVVTGAAGFLGRHVASAVLDAGHECVVFDIARPPGRLLDAGAVWRPGSITSVVELRRAFQGADAVLHLAGVGDVYLAARQPSLAAELNVVGCAHVAEASLSERVRRVIYASTWEVYGRPQYEPVDEQHPTDPDHPYNITKLAGERLLLSYDALQDLAVVSLRLGTAYGTGMRDNSVFSKFIGHALRGEPVTVSGDGSQHRQFTHAGDIGRAFVAAAESDLRHEVVNIVAEETVTIKRLAEMIVAAAPAPVRFGEPRPGDVAPAHVSAAKARELLGWTTHIPFARGLHELVEHFRSARARPGWDA